MDTLTRDAVVAANWTRWLTDASVGSEAEVVPIAGSVIDVRPTRWTDRSGLGCVAFIAGTAAGGGILSGNSTHVSPWVCINSPVNFSAVSPGQALTSDALKSLAKRSKLLGTIDLLRVHGFASSLADGRKITAAAACSGKAFVAAIPERCSMPSVAPDGDGGLTFTWRTRKGGLIVVIDGVALHAVYNPGTSEAQYLDDIPFGQYGLGLPSQLLEFMPSE